MNNFYQLASSRRSIRKFEASEIPMEDIEYFIHAAITAPSGCNSQCWRFIAITNQEILGQLETAVIAKTDQILEIKKDEIAEDYFTAKRKMMSFFAKAPLVIAVFMTEAEYWDSVFTEALHAHSYDAAKIMELFAHFDLLSIGAAIQNMLLAIHEKGYGACWMNDPAIAAAEINQILGVPKEHTFISLIPVGKSAYTPREKPMKELGEVFSVI